MKEHRLRYAEQAKLCQNVLAKKLLNLMDDKRSNLALSADVAHGDKLLAIADKIGPEICVLKTHIDIINDFTLELTHKLKQLAEKHGFLIFEDRKFADIGNTVKNQYQGGVYHIADWADIVNAHSLPGPGIIKGLAEVGMPRERGLLLLAEMSSEGNLLDPIYAQKTLEMAEQFPEFVIGFIAQRRLDDDSHWIYMTPGVRFGEGMDALGQQYTTPERAIVDHGTDIIIVGRGIINADDPIGMARKYREAGWKAYESIAS
jgi:orotidine 5'-phosphate decarboxylase subfamily 1